MSSLLCRMQQAAALSGRTCNPHTSFVGRRCFSCNSVAVGLSAKQQRQRQVWQVQASANIADYALGFVTENIWPAVTNIASYAFGFVEFLDDDQAPEVGNSNSVILNWVTTIIANRLQLRPKDVLLDTKLEDMVFLGGKSDSNFRTVESLMDIEDLFSVIIHPNYIDTLASYTVRELSDLIESQYLISLKELQHTLFSKSYNYNVFLLERMLQTAIGNVLNMDFRDPKKLDMKLSSCQANPVLLKESLRDLKGKFGVDLDYATFKDSTIRDIAKRIISHYNYIIRP